MKTTMDTLNADLEVAKPKAAPLKKTAQAKPLPKSYTIKVEALVPCSLVYTLKAENPEEALKLLPRTQPIKVHPHTQKQRMNKAVVYETGYSTIKLTKSF